MRPNALPDAIADIWIFDDLEFMLLALVEEAVESIGLQADGLCDKTGEEHAHSAHLRHVTFIYRPEVWHEVCTGPLIRTPHVVI